MIAAINWVNVLNISVQMLADARAFEARATEDAAFPALVDTPWCVTTPDGGLAILVEHNDDDTITMTPGPVRTHLLGFSCMTRRDAETIAAYYPDYVVTAHKDIAALRAASLRRCADAARALSAELHRKNGDARGYRRASRRVAPPASLGRCVEAAQAFGAELCRSRRRAGLSHS